MEATVQRLQRDMDHVVARMATLEKLTQANKSIQDSRTKVSILLSNTVEAA
jgi:hypothetical protein